MVIGIRNLQWLNHNANRRYPLAAECSLQDSTGSFTIPDSLLVSLYFPVHWGLAVETNRFFLLSLGSYPTGVKLVLGYAGDSGDVEVAVALISAATHSENKVYPLTGVGDFSDSRGTVVIGSLEELENQPSGEFEFTLDTARFESDCIRPSLRAVTGLIFQNGGESSEVLSGYIRIRAGRNTRFRVEQAPGEDPVVHWDAIAGAGLTEDCVCDEGLADPIRTINGVGPDGSGNLQLRGNDCLTVSAAGHAIQLADICSEPCCGSQEAEVITRALETLQAKADTLQNFINELKARVTQMDMVVLGSRLGDQGCVPAADCPDST